MKNQRTKFSIPRGVTYLNCAYMSPLMKQVERAGLVGMKRKQNPANISAADFFSETEILRKEYARLIHVTDPKRIVVIPSVSYGIANAARNIRLKADSTIVLIDGEFPSNYYSWHRLAADTGATITSITPPDSPIDRARQWNQRILEAIRPGTGIVALGNVHWTDGTRFDLEQIGKRARDVGAKLVVDGSQSVGALPFDVSKIKPDALICAGYKWLMGPYSVGLAYYGEHFDGGIPIEESWLNRLESEDFTGLVNYQERYQPGALRYEVGEHSNFTLVPMMLEALRQINAWRPERIQDYCRAISKAGILRLKERGFWIEEDAFRGAHIFGIRFPKGIGTDKIKLLMKKRKISVSFRGDSMRVSPHLYNDKRDFDRLVELLVSLKP